MFVGIGELVLVKESLSPNDTAVYRCTDESPVLLQVQFQPVSGDPQDFSFFRASPPQGIIEVEEVPIQYLYSINATFASVMDTGFK